MSRAGSVAALLATPATTPTIVWLDEAGLREVERVAAERKCHVGELGLPGPVVAVCEGTLATGFEWLRARNWLSHVVTTQLLSHVLAPTHIQHVTAMLLDRENARLLDLARYATGGRRSYLTRASERSFKLERMAEVLHANGISQRRVTALRVAAEEMIVRAFYDAPLAAGAVLKGIPREADVALPEDTACELFYGITDDLVVIRVRDPFGAILRHRLLDDDTLSRIMAGALFAAVSVVREHHTDYVIVHSRHDRGEQLAAGFHVFWAAGSKRRQWQGSTDESVQPVVATFITSTTEVTAS